MRYLDQTAAVQSGIQASESKARATVPNRLSE